MGIDHWEDAVNTYKENFKTALTFTGDIVDLNGASILKFLNTDADSIDVIIGGPPCQGFSISGKRVIDDPRNVLYRKFVDIVSDIQPKVFVMENVPGLIRLFDGKVKDRVIKDFSDVGYNVSFQVLSSERYGVPQVRKRVFFVGLNKDKLKNTKTFLFPDITHGYGLGLKPIVTSKDAI